MKVLTLREPFASLIGEQLKTIETRSWHTNYRGDLYIHAGIKKESSKDPRIIQLKTYLHGSLHYGKIFLKCKLTDCILIDRLFADQIKKNDPINYLSGNYNIGRYAWVLEEIEYIEEIDAKGQLGIWNYSI